MAVTAAPGPPSGGTARPALRCPPAALRGGGRAPAPPVPPRPPGRPGAVPELSSGPSPPAPPRTGLTCRGWEGPAAPARNRNAPARAAPRKETPCGPCARAPPPPAGCAQRGWGRAKSRDCQPYIKAAQEVRTLFVPEARRGGRASCSRRDGSAILFLFVTSKQICHQMHSLDATSQGFDSCTQQTCRRNITWHWEMKL
ncbi:basic proline-rich protein-like [Pseudopipra pipra]|uniref:basic proline-rich protein-like n=1 Tax=Pseudopipra pipra TaxID=415032 RepID=UPI003138F8ED